MRPGWFTRLIETEELNFKMEEKRRTGRPMKPSEVSRFRFHQGWKEILEEPGGRAPDVGNSRLPST